MNTDSFIMTPEPLDTLTVCGGKISDPDRYPSALYRGQRVYFCTRACRRVFASDPDRFIAGEIEHPVDEDPPAPES